MDVVIHIWEVSLVITIGRTPSAMRVILVSRKIIVIVNCRCGDSVTNNHI